MEKKKDKSNGNGEKQNPDKCQESINASIVPTNYGNDYPMHQADSSQNQANTPRQRGYQIAAKTIVKWCKKNTMELITLLVNVVLVLFTIRAVSITRDTLLFTTKSFETQNRPFLQIKDLRISNDTLYYSLNNFGNYPAKIISGKFEMMPLPTGIPIDGMDWNNPANSNAFILNWEDTNLTVTDGKIYRTIRRVPMADETIINTYVIKEFPLERSIRKSKRAPIIVSDPLPKITQIDFYFFGYIVYQNEVTETKREYIFNVKVNEGKVQPFEFVTNKNQDIPKE